MLRSRMFLAPRFELHRALHAINCAQRKSPPDISLSSRHIKGKKSDISSSKIQNTLRILLLSSNVRDTEDLLCHKRYLDYQVSMGRPGTKSGRPSTDNPWRPTEIL